MTAKEMFELLGYKQNKNEWSIQYIKQIHPDSSYLSKTYIIEFRTELDNCFYKYDEDLVTSPISINEYKAINK